jgi:hypothetical protein
MAFDEQGFLSPDLLAWMTTTRGQFKDWFDLVENFNREAMKILFAIESSPFSNRELVVSLLYRRAVQSFQGAVLLAERGMIADARSLVRSCSETAIAIGCVASDEKFVDDLIEDHDKHRLTFANVHLNDPDSREASTPQEIEKLQNFVAEVRARYVAPRPRSIKWDQAARKADMAALYDTTYRMTSGDAVHTTVYAIDRHVQPDEHGKIGHLTFRPESRDLAETLSVAANAVLHSMEAITRVFPQEEFKQTVRSCMEWWRSLVGV